MSLCLSFPPLSLPDCIFVSPLFLYFSLICHPSLRPAVIPTQPPRRSLAGYNNLEVAEYLLEHGADVNAQDKGGLIPLHNAASYGVRHTYTHTQLS